MKPTQKRPRESTAPSLARILGVELESNFCFYMVILGMGDGVPFGLPVRNLFFAPDLLDPFIFSSLSIADTESVLSTEDKMFVIAFNVGCDAIIAV